jgi:hypothetical protein
MVENLAKAGDEEAFFTKMSVKWQV